MKSQTKNEIIFVLDKYHQLLLKENMKAAPDKSHFFLTRLKFFGHINAIIKLQSPSNKKKIQDFLGMLNFLIKYVYKMQLHLGLIYNFLRQQNNFEWTTEHQKQFEELKHSSLNKYQILFQIQTNHFVLCATPQILASAQHCYNQTVEQIK